MATNVGIVLGATRGIGLALVESLASYWGSGSHVYLTARKAEDGQAVKAALAAKGLQVESLEFDLADPLAAMNVAKHLQERHGGVDAVIQNGAYMPRANMVAAVDARPMIAANNHGTLRVLRAFLPVLRPHARMVVVASSLGVLSKLPPWLQQRIIACGNDPDAINQLMDDYVAAAEAGTAEAQGWPAWVNIPSKVGQVAVVRAFAQWAVSAGQLPAGALINAANPGVTLTDATRDFMGTVFKLEEAQSPEQAAEPLLWLATLPPDSQGPHGELVERRRIIPFADVGDVGDVGGA